MKLAERLPNMQLRRGFQTGSVAPASKIPSDMQFTGACGVQKDETPAKGIRCCGHRFRFMTMIRGFACSYL